MRHKPDHGEQSYRGCGKLTDRKGATSAARATRVLGRANRVTPNSLKIAQPLDGTDPDLPCLHDVNSGKAVQESAMTNPAMRNYFVVKYLFVAARSLPLFILTRPPPS